MIDARTNRLNLWVGYVRAARRHRLRSSLIERARVSLEDAEASLAHWWNRRNDGETWGFDLACGCAECRLDREDARDEVRHALLVLRRARDRVRSLVTP